MGTVSFLLSVLFANLFNGFIEEEILREMDAP